MTRPPARGPEVAQSMNSDDPTQGRTHLERGHSTSTMQGSTRAMQRRRRVHESGLLRAPGPRLALFRAPWTTPSSVARTSNVDTAHPRCKGPHAPCSGGGGARPGLLRARGPGRPCRAPWMTHAGSHAPRTWTQRIHDAWVHTRHAAAEAHDPAAASPGAPRLALSSTSDDPTQG